MLRYTGFPAGVFAPLSDEQNHGATDKFFYKHKKQVANLFGFVLDGPLNIYILHLQSSSLEIPNRSLLLEAIYHPTSSHV